MAGSTPWGVKKILRRGLFAVLRHKFAALAVTAAALAAALLALQSGKFANDISCMLPENSGAAAAYSRIRSCTMFNKAMILLESNSDKTFLSTEFAEKYDELADRLAARKDVILRVDHRLWANDNLLDVPGLLPYAMQLCTPDILPDAEKLPRQVMKELINPLSTGRSESLRQDPAGISRVLLRSLNRFREISALSTAIDAPWIMSSDRRYVLLTAETNLELSDPGSAKILQQTFEQALAAVNMTKLAKYQLILPHKRAEINEKIIKNDVSYAALLTLVFFGVLTLIFYRGNWRSWLIFLLTFPAGLLSSGLLIKVFNNPQLFVLGLAGVVTGIAVDYGVHIYSTMNSCQPYRRLAELLPSLFIGMLTSASAFAVFVLSPVEGARQLGFFAGSALFFALLLMLFILPIVLKNKRRMPELPLHKIQLHLQYPKLTAALFSAVAIAALMLLPKLKIHGDIRQYDMATASCEKSEQLVLQIFQNNRTAGIALIEGKSAEEVLESAAAAAQMDIFSLAELLPPAKIQQKNLEAWRKFDLESYGKALRKASIKAGFPADYFSEALRNIENARQQTTLAAAPNWLNNIKNRLLVKGSNERYYTLLMYNEKSNAGDFLKNLDNCSVISRSQLPVVMARDIMRSLLPTALLAICTVLIICGVCFRSIKKIILIMLPVAYSLLFCLGFYALIGKGINIPVMAAAAILCGIGVDYGILVLHALESKKTASILHSITISAVTTFAGGATVAFARHPMLHDAGITLLIGITVIWATAMFLLPVLYKARR